MAAQVNAFVQHLHVVSTAGRAEVLFLVLQEGEVKAKAANLSDTTVSQLWPETRTHVF